MMTSQKTPSQIVSYFITRRACSVSELLEEQERICKGNRRYVPKHLGARLLSDPVGDGFVMMRSLNEIWQNFEKAERWLIHFDSEAEAMMFRLDWSDFIEGVEAA